MRAGIAESRLADGVGRAECRCVRSGYLSSARGGDREAGTRGAGPGEEPAYAAIATSKAKILPQDRGVLLLLALWGKSGEPPLLHSHDFSIHRSGPGVVL